MINGAIRSAFSGCADFNGGKNMKTLKSFFPQIFGGIAAGIMVGIGGTVFMSCESKIVGAVMFTVALLSICCLDFCLFTGKIGFVAESVTKRTAPELAVGLAGNFAGATLTGFIVRFACPAIIERAAASCMAKLDNGILRAFILGCFCGMLMYAAVKIYRSKGSIAGIVFCIPVFILSGFEHSIADMFYFSLAGMVDFAYLGFIVAVIAGNSVGAIVLAGLWRASGNMKG